MDRYGNDKPDLRFGMPIVDLSEIAKSSSVRVLPLGRRGRRRASRRSRRRARPSTADAQLDELKSWRSRSGRGGLAWAAFQGENVRSSFARNLGEGELDAIRERAEVTGRRSAAGRGRHRTTSRRNVLGRLRGELGARLGLIDESRMVYAFITEFPYFERDEDTGGVTFVHHPFTMPFDEDMPYIESDPLRVRAKAYDLVANGYELASGSIRIHRREVQQAVFRALGLTEDQIERRFGHMLRAFELRRAAARRDRAGHRPAGDAAGRRDEHPRGDRLPEEPERRRPDDGRAVAGRGGQLRDLGLALRPQAARP